MKKTFRNLNIITSFILLGCTGYIQALNVAINKLLKDKIGELANIFYNKNFTKWEKKSYSVKDRRIMLTKWIDQAWKKLYANQNKLIYQLFCKLGVKATVRFRAASLVENN